MAVAKLFNLARMGTSTTGTGTITLGSAVTSYLTFAGAGVSDGDTVSYGIVDGSNREVGRGVYTSSGTTLTRSVVKSTNSDAAISLSGSAEVFIVGLSEDIFDPVVSSIFSEEKSAADADEAGYGQWWVKDDTPNTPMFTDDAGNDLEVVTADRSTTLNTGYATTPFSAGTKSSGTYTPDESDGALQYATNGGAHTLAPPSNNGTLIILYTNNGSAGTITTSGFTQVTGDNFDTTDGNEFMCYITKHNNGSAFSHLHITALQ